MSFYRNIGNAEPALQWQANLPDKTRNYLISSCLITLQKIVCHETDLQQFFGKLEKPIQAVVESTANWYWISDWCHQQDIHLTLAHSKMLKAIS